MNEAVERFGGLRNVGLGWQARRKVAQKPDHVHEYVKLLWNDGSTVGMICACGTAPVEALKR
jgi:hypothetical protein